MADVTLPTLAVRGRSRYLRLEESFSSSMGMKSGANSGVQVSAFCRAAARSCRVMPCTLLGGGLKLMGK